MTTIDTTTERAVTEQAERVAELFDTAAAALAELTAAADELAAQNQRGPFWAMDTELVDRAATELVPAAVRAAVALALAAADPADGSS